MTTSPRELKAELQLVKAASRPQSHCSDVTGDATLFEIERFGQPRSATAAALRDGRDGMSLKVHAYRSLDDSTGEWPEDVPVEW